MLIAAFFGFETAIYSTDEEPNPENEEPPRMTHIAPGFAVQFLKLDTTPPPPRKSKAARPVAPAEEDEEVAEEEVVETLVEISEDVTRRISSIYPIH